MTEVLAPDAEGIAAAVAILHGGGIVAFPTDTVYGVAVAATKPDRVDALFALKQRPTDRRIPLLVADLGQAVDAGWNADDRALALAERFWPGGLTIVLPGDATSQAVRAPNHPVALELIRAAGPLFTTSANLSDEPDTWGADEVLIAFATQQDLLDAVVDGGAVPGGVASTVIDLTVTPARILREGPIGRAEIGEVVQLEA
ncbi:MAG TPA: L-threonylcarbamoyladenylate synthase [Candidatus Limnocylindria bacterium]